ncbi:hypothetical protein PVA44_07565 (plasmid) [Entomospira nematocerorum]|uniref:Uncharacterized protein n=1 Tax=Entomospira nematocerorum TaxID=2719987 RepID=A0A968GEG0_9SPIO|nr:hypothetical protein [Entomospira nematocera]NIZ47769.1 hypothetical protein [Entomospira nematocera]WDI34723.1 hypothetical protein PVA44_07565 [Entomospira nematocera]
MAKQNKSEPNKEATLEAVVVQDNHTQALQDLVEQQQCENGALAQLLMQEDQSTESLPDDSTSYKVLHAISYRGSTLTIGSLLDSNTIEAHIVQSLLSRGMIRPLSTQNPQAQV